MDALVVNNTYPLVCFFGLNVRDPDPPAYCLLKQALRLFCKACRPSILFIRPEF